MAVQGGFVIGHADLGDAESAGHPQPARACSRSAASLGARGERALLVRADGVVTLIALRVATGAALAWVYPPGMKVAAGWFDEAARRGARRSDRRADRRLGVSASCCASASATIPWRTLMVVGVDRSPCWAASSS